LELRSNFLVVLGWGDKVNKVSFTPTQELLRFANAHQEVPSRPTRGQDKKNKKKPIDNILYIDKVGD
jgi:hypothetical protein